jgi:hypothetical protein
MARGCPKEKASIFKMHTVKKGLDKNLYIVSKKTNGVKYWKKTSKEEKKCRNDFNKNVSKSLELYKLGKFINNKQAIAVAYSKTYSNNKNCKKYLQKKSQKIHRKNHKRSQKRK